MSSQLTVKRLDSPLARSRPAAEPASADASVGAAPLVAESPAPAPKRPARRSVSVPPPHPVSESLPPVTDFGNIERLPDPPPLDEPLELLSSRLPASLRRSLSLMTTALRAQSGERLSQKALPEQEVLALLVWMAGSPDDDASVDRLAKRLNEFRARRYAAAAAALHG